MALTTTTTTAIGNPRSIERSCDCFHLVDNCQDIPGSDECGEHVVELADAEGVGALHDRLGVPVDDSLPEFGIVLPE